MCGIAGIMNFDRAPVPESVLESMCAVLVHRGPDDQGTYRAPGIGLAMRRLAIIDLDTGQQPVCNEDGTVHVVLNGEIYNYRELRSMLIARGHRFRTQSDTETIVHLYEEFGSDCVKKLRGMFAFALWDDRKKLLLLARDRLGIKPLYYTVSENRLAFASELKALLQLPDVERELDWGAVNYLFTFLTTPPAQSIIAGVKKLEPGCLLVASFDAGMRVRSYWNVHFDPDYHRNEDDCIENLRELIEESVRLRMISDVPLGAFLSGGIDSSAVVATMSGLSADPVKTFTIGFDDPTHDEATHARRFAAQIGADHHELFLEPDVTGFMEDLTWFLDEPFGDSSALPTYMVSKLASAHVKVVLSGDGGDELFAGYDKYLVEARERSRGTLPAFARSLLGRVADRMPFGMRGRNFLQHHSFAGLDRYLDASTLFRNDTRRALFSPEAFARMQNHDPWEEMTRCIDTEHDHWLSEAQYLDIKRYLPLDILTKVDRMSMAHSIEARVPLLDHKLVEFAATIPPSFKLHNGGTKTIFKRAMRGILPDEIIDRPKQGFAVPLGAWFRGGLADFVQDLLLSETSRHRGVFDTRCIENLIRVHGRGRNLYPHLWTLISFELWCRTFLDRPHRASDMSGNVYLQDVVTASRQVS